MADDDLVVARIVGDELRIERYDGRLRSWAALRLSENQVADVLAKFRPNLLVWSADDSRARALGEAGARIAPAPGVVETSGWADLPLQELLRHARGAEAAGEPPSEAPAEQERPLESAQPADAPPPPRAEPEQGEEAEARPEAPRAEQAADMLEGEPEVTPKPDAVSRTSSELRDLAERLDMVLSARARKSERTT